MTETETVPEAAVPPETLDHSGREAQLLFEVDRLRARCAELEGERDGMWRAVCLLWADARLRDCALGDRFGTVATEVRMREIELVFALLTEQGLLFTEAAVSRVEKVVLNKALDAWREAKRRSGEVPHV